MKEYEKLFNTKKYVVNQQNNSINGYFIRNKKKYFYKIIDKMKFFNEINGYLSCDNQIPIMKVLETGKIKENYYIIYDYNLDISKDKGTLNDLFVEYDEKTIIDKKQYTKIIDIYDKNLKNIINLYNSKNDTFFRERINSRLIKWYNKFALLDKLIKIDDEIFDLRKLIKETEIYFSKQHNLACFFTQGDPNTLNIGLSPCFFDLETCGYNSIMGELAITVLSVLFYDNYFCPKYHQKSYFNHEKILEKYEIFTPIIEYKISNIIEIKCDFKTSKIRREYIKDYLNMLKSNNIIINKDIIYYIVMRLLCVFDIRSMEETDQIYSIYLICYFSKIITDSDDVANDLYKMVDKLNGGRNGNNNA